VWDNPFPLIAKNILDKERGRTFEKMPCLEELPPTITTCIKIKIKWAIMSLGGTNKNVTP